MTKLLECAMCDKEISPNALVCPNCGEPQNRKGEGNYEQVDMVEGKEKVTSSNVKNKYSSKTLLKIIALITLVFVSAVFYYINTPKQKARSVVEKYLSALESGESTYDYKESYISDFNNLLSFEYLSLKSHYELKNSFTYDYDMYRLLDAEKYDRFPIALKEKKLEYEEMGYEVSIQNYEELEIWQPDDYKDAFTFIYNVEVTNGLGNVVVKRINITATTIRDDMKIIMLEY